MNLKKHPALILIFTALLVTVCRCSAIGQFAMQFTDGTIIGCKEYLEYFADENQSSFSANSVYVCNLPCPDGSLVSMEFINPGSDVVGVSHDKAEFQAQYCTPEQSDAVVASTETPTVSPTETPTQEPQPEIDEVSITPVLAGGVTACDTGLGFINFPLANPLPDLTGKSVSIMLNGSRVNCQVAGSGSQVLGCSLPAGTIFPLSVSAAVDGTEVNNFSFNGAICTRTEPTKGSDTEENEQPAIVPTPDCEVDPDPYNC